MIRLKLRFRIGAKLAVAAGIGVLLVTGMVANEQWSDAAITQSNRVLARQQSIRTDVRSAQMAILRAENASRDILLSRSAKQVDEAAAALQASDAEAIRLLDSAAGDSLRAEDRAPLTEMKTQLEDYVTAVENTRTAQKDSFAANASQVENAAKLDKAFDDLLASPLMAGLAHRREVEADLRDARSLAKDARIAFWRYTAGGEAEMADDISVSLEKATALLRHARDFAAEKAVQDAIDGLVGAVGDLRDTMDKGSMAAGLVTRIQIEGIAPVRAAIGQSLDKAIAAASREVELRRREADAEIAEASRIGLFAGALVVVMLIASAVFSRFNIAGPVRRIGEVLHQLAKGNSEVEIPYANRVDEVGDNARAAKIFKDNLLRIRTMEAEQKAVEARAAAQRKAELEDLAAGFEAAVGDIIETVSSTANELEAAASTLTDTAETTQKLSTIVAGASEEASANVQSVASATEQLALSVSEIARQVQESSRIAIDAVRQAEETDARINELSKASSSIGDAVKIITAIAEQTNLLALNATIEAARAGEAGRGFAVVASEVKALAAQTAKATEEIGSQITGIQVETQQSVAAIKAIGTTIHRISEIATVIAAAVEQQGATTQAISRNVHQAAQGTSQVASNIADVSTGAGETGTASSQVLASAKSLSSESHHLKIEVEKFLATIRVA